jgi:hypothetical protein
MVGHQDNHLWNVGCAILPNGGCCGRCHYEHMRKEAGLNGNPHG